MTSNRQAGYAFTELMIASALFSAGLLTQVKLNTSSVQSLSDLAIADQQDNHMQSVMLFAAITPSTPQQLHDSAQTLDGVSITRREVSLPAPLSQADITTNSVSARSRLSYSMVVTGQHTGHWHDIEALLSQ